MILRLKSGNLLPMSVLVLAGLLAAPDSAQGKIEAEAFAGGRFGVGRIRMSLPQELQPAVLGPEAICLDEKNGRVLYPAIKPPVLGGLFTDMVGRPPRITIYFLFRGNEPLELTLRGRSTYTLRLTPRHDPRDHRKLLEDWWERYTKRPGLLQKQPDYPPLVKTYLRSTLARRMSLRLPEKEQTESWQDQLERELGLTLGTESVQLDMLQNRVLGLANLDQVADQPLPAPVAVPAMEFPPTAADVPIEPIAMRVPSECFYVRFGSFANFLWTQDTLAKWGGDLSNLMAARGLDHGMSLRMEQQLVMKQTPMSRLLGGTLIADVAILGTDMFFREGAAYGILFYARQGNLLAVEMSRQRSERLAAGGVEQQQVDVDGHQVSLLVSADGTVRSYHVSDGAYQFLTNSKTLARRFLETASGNGALGASEDFRHGRSEMPLAREDTVFVYLSDAFFRNFTGPRYRVEIARRLQATADIDLVRLAVLASAAEGKPGHTIEELIAGELLPADFGPRPDGSQTVLGDGRVHDSLRGYRGTFLPIPDTPVDRVTPAELSAYRRFADFYHQNWGRLDPMIVGIKREALPENREKVVMDARMCPFALEHFRLLSRWAGPPNTHRLAPIQGNIISAEFVMPGQHLFGGLSDFGPPPGILDDGGILDGGILGGFLDRGISGGGIPGRGTLDSAILDSAILDRGIASLGRLTLGEFRDILVGYVGTAGELGLLRLLDIQIPSPPDANGYSANRLGLWRRQFDQFTVFSLHPEVLASVTPQLRFVEAERPAQFRLYVGDVSQARMTPFLNQWGYRRTQQTSLGNLRLMNSLEQQLHVPTADCREAAEFLMDAKLTCPLGGEYELQQSPDGTDWWTSTAFTGERGLSLLGPKPPAGYQAPPLNWLRGLDLDASMTKNVLSAHGQVIMQLPEEKGK